MDRLVKQHEQVSRRAMELVARDPALDYISALVIAGDLMTAESAIEAMKAGDATFDEAYRAAGSYGRFEVIYAALESGHVSFPTVASMLADEWSGSDPDDTDPRALDLWRRASVFFDGVLIEQPGAESDLPPGRTLLVYRGQDIMVGRTTFGIAWSLDRRVAERFANGTATRQGNRWGVVYAADVRREHILGWMPNRGESEVIIDPQHLISPAIVSAPTPMGLPR